MNKPLGPKHGINEIIDVLTQQLIDKRDAEGSVYNPLRPSGAGRCERELGFAYAEFKGYAKYDKTPNTPDVHRLLNFGHHVERHLIEEMRNAFRLAPKPIQIKYQQQTLTFFTLHDGTIIEGNIDGVLISENWKIIMDVKSKKEKFSSYFKSSWEEFGEWIMKMPSVSQIGEGAFWIDDLDAFLAKSTDAFFNANLFQLCLYSTHEFITERGIDCASLIYYSKNASTLREVRFRPSKKVAEYIEKKFKKVAEVIDKTKDPLQLDREYQLGSAKCAFCPFSKQCWENDDALKIHFKGMPPKRWPKDTDRLKSGTELEQLFEEYMKVQAVSDQQVVIEQQILSALDKEKVDKVRLKSGQIFEVKTLKSGGVGGGARKVIRRGKL